MSKIRKLILIPITVISHILAEIHAEYVRIFRSKLYRQVCEDFNAGAARAKADVAAAKAAAEKAGMTVVEKTAQAAMAAASTAPVLPH